MKYELGDKVKIKKHWKKQNRTDQLEMQEISNLENYLQSDDMSGGFVNIVKYKKEPIKETGYICGIREFKVEYDLQYVVEEPYVKDGVQQINYKTEKTYIVATKMNGLRRVSFEDIEFIK